MSLRVGRVRLYTRVHVVSHGQRQGTRSDCHIVVAVVVVVVLGGLSVFPLAFLQPFI